MAPRLTTTIVTYGLLAGVGAVSFMMPDALTVPVGVAAAPGGDLQLTGIIRDFYEAHDDFAVVPAAGLGHYADTVEPALGPDGVPVFNAAGGGGGGGGGYTVHVDETFTLLKGTVGTPGLFVATNSTAAGAIEIAGDGTVDSDVLVGPGGSPATVIDNTGVITGTTGTLGAPHPMTPVVAPDDTVVGPNLGSAQYKDTPTTISTNQHYDDLRINTNGSMVIDGNLVIRVDGALTVETGGSIVVTPGSTLDLYVLGDVAVKTKSQVTDATAIRLHVVGAPKFVVETEADFYATVYAPQADILVQTKSVVNGPIVARNLLIKTGGSVVPPAPPPAAPGGGYKVAAQWQDSTGRNIAPQLFNVGPAAAPPPALPALLAANGKLTGDLVTIDGFDSSAGSYGGANAGLPIVLSSNGTGSNIVSMADTTISGDLLSGPGSDPGTAIKLSNVTMDGSTGTLTGPVPMPTVTVPTDLGPSAGDLTINGTTLTMSTSGHYEKFAIDGGGELRIDGDVVILAEKEFKVSNASKVTVLPGGRLTVYGQGNFKVENGSWVNPDTGDPSVMLIRLENSDTVDVDGGSVMWARVEAPAGDMMVAGGSTFYGTFVGQEFHAQDNAAVHVDLAGTGGGGGGGCYTVADVAGVKGADGDGGISSAATFDQWFRSVPGTNLGIGHVLPLTWNAAGGYYQFSSVAWHPISGRLLGNEGDAHNGNFTFAFRADFTFSECAGQFFQAAGSDGLWVYIDGQLVIDGGGVENGLDQTIDLDRLGLTDGEVYRLDFFAAERHAAASQLKIRTNLELSTERYLPTVTQAFD